MSGFLRLFGIAAVYVVALIAWLVLGGITQSRSSSQSERLHDEVSNLWGDPQAQVAPEIAFFAENTTAETEVVPLGADTQSQHVVIDGQTLPVLVATDGSKYALKRKAAVGVGMSLSSSAIVVDLHSDPRRKGLVWYPLYDVAFQGTYGYEHRDTRAGVVALRVAFPSTTALYDELLFEVNGRDRRDALDPKLGVLELRVPVKQGDKLDFRVGYKSRGSQEWSYKPAQGVQRLENFALSMRTNFGAIDFPQGTLSPTKRSGNDNGWALEWGFRNTITGQGIGMTMPAHIQPGELAAALSFSAPVSLLFFFVVLFVLATLRNLEIHPINYLFISCAFFAFHLLFSYSVDHLAVPWAFGLSSAVSMALVVSYLRLVVSTKFALRETALAQVLYLIVFSLAHFWEGYTGLTVTVLAILTLFVLMQTTGRIKWSEALKKKRAVGPDGTPLTA